MITSKSSYESPYSDLIVYVVKVQYITTEKGYAKVKLTNYA